ncbi:hypothetical protein [Streptomyces flaveolus]|uniref:hypothetical protein n=1 Tax=Streptomyces flaveolus TaxID=67297 RepID=UPI0036C074B3
MDDTILVSRFLRDGFVKLEGAVAPRVAADCARLLWRETRIRAGSHLDVPKVLEKYGEDGASGLTLAPDLVAVSDHRPLALATGSPGDVFLCHPFLVHAAQPHHGVRPRFMAQPPLLPAAPYELERADGAYSPVEIAIRRGLGQDTAGPDGEGTDR